MMSEKFCKIVTFNVIMNVKLIYDPFKTCFMIILL